MPMRKGKRMPLAARLAYLERKVNGGLSWVRRPHSKTHSVKDYVTPAKEFPLGAVLKEVHYDCKNYSMNLFEGTRFCFDYFTKHVEQAGRTAVIYDFGIREQPEFGLFFAKAGKSCSGLLCRGCHL